MPTEKLVDGDFLAKLVAGSYEVAMGAVEETVAAHATEVFGDGAKTIATFSDHFIVATPAGEFYRGKWSLTEEGVVELSEIDAIDVPVYEANAMSTEVRREANEAVDLLLAGENEMAEEKLRHLFGLVNSGAKLTAEGVEDLYQKQTWGEADWFQAVRENESTIRKLLGTEALRLSVPKPRFEAVVEMDEDAAERHRAIVIASLRNLKANFGDMGTKLALATEIKESYVLRGNRGQGVDMAVSDFVEFVQDFTEDLAGAAGIVDDALAVADDGCVPCLARVHDGITEQMYEWTLAAAFAEKLARRFEAPQAA
jgi:hypothetical protein